MKDEQTIRAAVEAFKLASACVNAAWQLREDHLLDTRIAEREGKEVEAATAAEAMRRAQREWSKAYTERDHAAVELCEALGVDPKTLKGAL